MISTSSMPASTVPPTVRSAITNLNITRFVGSTASRIRNSARCHSKLRSRGHKSSYRRFRIRSVEGVDDYAAIREVITRRYRYAADGDELYPDVILIDGGLGQLHAGLEAFDEMNLRPPMVISLAKREEEIYIQARSAPVRLSRNNEALRLLQSMRDEAHRFAQHYHHILRRRKTFETEVAQGRRPPRGGGTSGRNGG